MPPRRRRRPAAEPAEAADAQQSPRRAAEEPEGAGATESGDDQARAPPRRRRRAAEPAAAAQKSRRRRTEPDPAPDDKPLRRSKRRQAPAAESPQPARRLRAAVSALRFALPPQKRAGEFVAPPRAVRRRNTISEADLGPPPAGPPGGGGLRRAASTDSAAGAGAGGLMRAASTDSAASERSRSASPLAELVVAEQQEQQQQQQQQQPEPLPPAAAEAPAVAAARDQRSAVWTSQWSQERARHLPAAPGRLDLLHKVLDVRVVLRDLREQKRNHFYNELLVYLCFLGVFCLLCLSIPVHESFVQTSAVGRLTAVCGSTFGGEGAVSAPVYGDDGIGGGGASSVTTMVDAGTCDRDGVWDVLRGLEDAVCVPTAAAGHMLRIGDVRVRQVRSLRSECAVPALGASMPCIREFEVEREDTSDPDYTRGLGELRPVKNERVESYGHGGVVESLCRDRGALDRLEAARWIDDATAAVAVDFTLVSSVSQLFSVVQVVLEVLPVQTVAVTCRVGNVSLLLADAMDAGTLARFAASVTLCALFMVYNVLNEVMQLRVVGLRTYWRDKWNLYEALQAAWMTYLLALLLRYHAQSAAAVAAIRHAMADADEFVDMQPMLAAYQRITNVVAITSVLSLLKIFKYLQLNSNMYLLWRTLGKAVYDLIGFFTMFSLIFVSYALFGTLAFGFQVRAFQDLPSAVATCSQMLVGNFDYDSLHRANPTAAPWFFGTFVVLVFLILVNVFVAILNDYYDRTQKEIAASAGADAEAIDYDLLNMLRRAAATFAPHVTKLGSPVVVRPQQTVVLISSNLADQRQRSRAARRRLRGAVHAILFLVRFRRCRLVPPSPTAARRASLRLTSVSSGSVSGSGPVDESAAEAARHKPVYVPLSADFDHQVVAHLLPVGQVFRLRGQSVLRDEVQLTVVAHHNYSVECQLLNHEDAVVEGREELAVSWLQFGRFLGWWAGHALWARINVLLGRTKRPEKIITDYDLERMLLEFRSPIIRYDQLRRNVDLCLRRHQRRRSLRAVDVDAETHSIMARFHDALADLSFAMREQAGYEYCPQPLPTRDVKLSNALLIISDLLAINCHEVWAAERINQGWRYGPQRDDVELLHPNLRPFHDLPESEQEFDRRTSQETLKALVYVGHKLVATSAVSLDGGAYTGGKRAAVPGETYVPEPLPTGDVELPPQMVALADQLAENAHELWSKGRMDQGWIYGVERSDELHQHPCLVPYAFLSDKEKEFDLVTAMETIKVVLALGYAIQDDF